MKRNLVSAAAMGLCGSAACAQLPGSDWITTGLDCRVFAGGDVDGDGFADVLTVNGGRDLCVAPSVHGWKSAGWRVVAKDISPDAACIAVGENAGAVCIAVVEARRLVLVPLAAGGAPGAVVTVEAPADRTLDRIAFEKGVVVGDSAGGWWRVGEAGLLVPSEGMPTSAGAAGEAVSAPPYEAGAGEFARWTTAYSSRGGVQAWGVFTCELPYRHRVVRTAVVRGDDPLDVDADGLSNAEEASIGSDPRDRDTDGDGLLDGWEVHGLPSDRLSDLGARTALFRKDAPEAERGAMLSPLRRDVLCNISYFDQVDRKKFEGEMGRIEAVYRAMSVKNPDGTTGVWMHLRELADGVPAADQRMPWWDVGNKYFPRRERGLAHWLQVTPWGGGQSSETGDMGGCGNNWAVFAHELGHQLGLSHTGDSAPGWCPLYPSLMNYAYSYSFDGDGSKPHFSTGEFRDVVLDERKLVEKLPHPFERVKFLAAWPFRFQLKDNGDGTTLIDWDHSGTFDEGEVVADVNYGGSTQAGDRKTHTLIGSAPSLASIGGRCVIAASVHKQNAVSLKSHKGSEQWTGETEVASTASRFDPVLIGGETEGVLFVRRFDGWAGTVVRPGATTEDAPSGAAPTLLKGLPLTDLSGVRVGERVLLLSRFDSGAVEARWLSVGKEFSLGEPRALALKSMVPPGMAVDPRDGSIVVVSSERHPDRGAFCMQLSTIRVEGDAITETPAEWSQGGKPVHCTTRPVPVFPVSGARGQLTIFHTGWSDGNGTWTGWRTSRVGNTKLDGGWLTCQIYDEWTRSRVAIGFADGPDGAFYAFRWDPGDHNDWKVNTMFVAHGGYGIDDKPMRDFDDGAKVGQWGIRHSILTMPTDAEAGLAGK